MFDFKESKISFEACADSPLGIEIPKGVFEISDSSGGLKETDNEFVVSRSDRCVILKCLFDPKETITSNNFYIMRIKVKAEYLRLENKQLDYVLEIKFKI